MPDYIDKLVAHEIEWWADDCPTIWNELVAVVAKTAEQHVSTDYPSDMQQICRTCRWEWPCPTAEILAALKAKVESL